jgi:hypothetical protein
MASTSIIRYSKKSSISNIQKKTNLISEMFYDLQWIHKKYAIEWWETDGHFNDELYIKVLEAKINLVK